MIEDEKRLIDANEFAKCLERMTKTAYPNLFPGLLEAIDYVKDFPTVDAVEVVRCKDCKKYRDPFCLLNDTQSGYLTAVSPDHFCSYGERRSV